MTEMLLAEIGHRATNDRLVDREGYSLMAGLALGLVTLGAGSSAVGLADLQIENCLRRYMEGGKDPTESSSAAPPDGTQSCRIKEGEMVNIDITAAGATLALGLMFLKTNNASVAARLSIPDTNFLMEYVRPDYLLLRVVSKALVMWDDIKPTQAWIESQVSLCLQHPRMLCLQHPQWLIAWPVSLLQSCLNCTVCAGAPR
jgi:anaphase-promoting complex subunit 1